MTNTASPYLPFLYWNTRDGYSLYDELRFLVRYISRISEFLRVNHRLRFIGIVDQKWSGRTVGKEPVPGYLGLTMAGLTWRGSRWADHRVPQAHMSRPLVKKGSSCPLPGKDLLIPGVPQLPLSPWQLHLNSGRCSSECGES